MQVYTVMIMMGFVFIGLGSAVYLHEKPPEKIVEKYWRTYYVNEKKQVIMMIEGRAKSHDFDYAHQCINFKIKP